MYQVDQIQKYLIEVESLALLAEVFTDLAKTKLDRIRAVIEQNRTYVSEIGNVLHVVRVTAEEKKLSASRRKKISASLLVTSNKRLYYGALDTKVANFFLAHAAYAGYVDRFVLGTVGGDILTAAQYPLPYERIAFAGDFPSKEEMTSLTKKLTDYQKVVVYYPRFVTVLTQIPTTVDVTGFLAASTPFSGASTGEDKYYLFEPEIEKILDFFEEQVVGLLLEQTFLEAELARVGTQLTTMDSARQNAAEVIGKKKMELALARKQFLNWQSLELAAGMLRREVEA